MNLEMGVVTIGVIEAKKQAQEWMKKRAGK
jgi:hypothetical protein